ncbi:unnamed protein product [Musa acuminata subsp. malaccensis]|uniref:(wild Malaysian banana) hypothetical protein n=1 Tax=Musa acuminata subsp. malaccensis TaxID=214687 RepID=A0A8D6ZP32_MUSAM|nr:unnamed protein product [Musa acuminata subsp. malaccensis]
MFAIFPEWDYQAVRSYLMLNWRRKLAGLLLEFRKVSQKTLPPVVQKPDGKKNWMVCDPLLVSHRILECSWMELSENKRTVTAEELAVIIYGSKEYLESYCSLLLLSRDDIYFSVVDSKGYCSLYERRPSIKGQYEDSLGKILLVNFQAAQPLPQWWRQRGG